MAQVPVAALDMAGNVWEWTASESDKNTRVVRAARGLRSVARSLRVSVSGVIPAAMAALSFRVVSSRFSL